MFDSGRLPQARDQQWRLLQVEVEVEVEVRWHGRLGRQAAALAREREAEETSRRNMRDNAILQDVTSRKW